MSLQWVSFWYWIMEFTLGEEGSEGGREITTEVETAVVWRFPGGDKSLNRDTGQWVGKMAGGDHMKCGILRSEILEVVLADKWSQKLYTLCLRPAKSFKINIINWGLNLTFCQSASHLASPRTSCPHQHAYSHGNTLLSRCPELPSLHPLVDSRLEEAGLHFIFLLGLTGLSHKFLQVLILYDCGFFPL